MIDSVLVSFTSAGLSLDGITNFCAGDQSTITATSTLNNIQFDTFDWSEDLIVVTGDGTNSVDVNPSSTQYLYVTATASNGCTVTDSILLSVSDIDVTYLAATASENTVPIGEDVTLSAEPSGYSYSWTPAADLTNPNSQETGATVNETTIYTVSVTDGICTKSDTVLVKAYSYKCEEPFLYVPNAFTPNGDQDNDVLYVRSTIVKDFVFRIFDRWGELVFESKSLHRGWDGTFREKLLDPDVYDYYVEGHCIDGQEFLIKGNVTLIR
jgi:gliding motility-associated-like protein